MQLKIFNEIILSRTKFVVNSANLTPSLVYEDIDADTYFAKLLIYRFECRSEFSQPILDFRPLILLNEQKIK